MPRGRFAPSPTGLLHLGGARTALLAWLAARSDGSSFVLRMEDLDRPRVVSGAAQAIIDDLRWLGLDWDEGPIYQSERLDSYDRALETLQAEGRIFECFCSRAEIASAPHAGEEGPRYAGACRSLPARPGRTPSIRLRVETGEVCFQDLVHGRYCQDVSALAGDFVLRRADGVYAYQLAVVVDDVEMGIEQVVRGDDLLPSTPRQLLLYKALGARWPEFAHVPLVLGPDRQRLSKRHGAVTVRDYRRAGISASQFAALLASSLNLCQPGDEVCPRELLTGFSLEGLPRLPTLWPDLAPPS